MERVTLDRIRNSKLREEEVEVPEWGGTVRLRAVTRGQLRWSRDEVGMEDGALKDGELADLLLLTCAFVEPVMEPGDKEAINALRSAPAGVVQRLIRRMLDLSGLTEEASKSDGPKDDDGG